MLSIEEETIYRGDNYGGFGFTLGWVAEGFHKRSCCAFQVPIQGPGSKPMTGSRLRG